MITDTLPSIRDVLSASTPKAQKIRALLDLGLPRSTVARLTNTRYQTVYQVDVARARKAQA